MVNAPIGYKFTALFWALAFKNEIEAFVSITGAVVSLTVII